MEATTDHIAPQVTTRAVFDVSRKCHLRCSFCYYLPTNSFFGERTWEDLKGEIDRAVDRGCDAADCTGGEPMTCSHIARVVEYALAKGVSTRIITSLNCPEKTLDDVLEAGVQDWLISMHGAKAETHDSIVHIPRARSFQIRRMAKIASRMRYCANYVMIAANQTEMADWARWLLSLDHEPPKVCNFINFNVFPEWEENGQEIRDKALANVTDLRICGPVLDEAIDVLEEAGIGVNVRYMPMCAVAERHRKNICNDLHVAFDQGEWDNAFGANTPVDQVYGSYSVPLSLRNEEKGQPCSGCGLQWICGGANKLWHKFALEKFGTEPLVQIDLPGGVHPKDFWHYRGQNGLGLDPRRLSLTTTDLAVPRR